MKVLPALIITWIILALGTLFLVIENESSLFAALVAWTGGVITCKLFQILKEEFRTK